MRRTSLALAFGLSLGCGSNSTSSSHPPAPAEPAAEETTVAAQPTPTQEPMPAATPPSEPELRQLADATNTFATALWHRVGASRSGNLVLAPTSIATALAMTAAGARGETAEQMFAVLHTQRDWLSRYGAQARGWNEPHAAYELAVANRLFGQDGYVFEPAFLQTARDVFGAPLETSDFRTAFEPSRARINAWVSDQTRTKIPELLPAGSLNELTRLVLVNAIYFRGTWKHRFEESQTRDEPFAIGGSDRIDVPTMRRTGSATYGTAPLAGGGEVQLLELGYDGDELSTIFVLPPEGTDLGAVERALSADTIRAWSSAVAPTDRVEIHLPRFRVEGAPIALKEPLGAVGMPLAFTSAADFSGMSTPANPDERLHIDDVYHATFVQVDEQGTEAAGATGVVMAARGAPMREPPTPVFRADRPFLFLLRDVRSGAVLFVGRITDPR